MINRLVMIKRIGLMIVCLNVFFSYGQTEGIETGIFAGINSSNLVGKGLKEWTADGKAKASYGFDVGLRMKQPLGKNWGFQHEAGFTLLTTKLEMEDDILYTSQFRRAAIHVSPANVFYQWGGFAVYAGPYFSFLTGASQQKLDEQGHKYRDKDIYGTAELEGDYMQKIDLGLKAGVAYTFSKRWGIGVQFMRGFTPILENTELKDQIRIYNQSVHIALHYNFSKGSN